MTSPFTGSAGGARGLPPHLARRIRLTILLGFAGLFILAVVVPSLLGLATDWLWFQEVGYQTVFRTQLGWRIALFVAGGTATFAFLYGNAWIASRGSTVAPVFFVDHGGAPRVHVSQLLPRIMWLAAGVVALVVAIAAAQDWMPFVTAFHGAAVGTVDPLFGRDIGFYLFRFEALEDTLDTAVALTLIALVAVSALYGVRGTLAIARGRKLTAQPGAAKHVGLLLALLLIEIAARVWFVGASNLLYSTTGPLVGASYTDVYVRLPAMRVSAIVALIGAGAVVFGAFRGQLARYAVLSVGTYIVVGIGGRGILPFAVQRLVVTANELAREKEFLQRHLTATRTAWGLDKVTTKELSGEAQLTSANIKANAATIDNVRLWERDLVRESFGQLQSIRTYYDFVSVTDDRYTIDGKYRQVHLAARELNVKSLPTRTFINERFTYTHGMGVTMAPVNQVTAEGLPLLFIKDLPPVSSVSIVPKRPQIYFGELTTSYVFTGTKQQEFDYPAGETDVHTAYTGRGGVAIGSLWRRLLFAWQFGSAKIVLSNDISGSARILYHRSIADRASTALPFLTFDPEAYLVINDAGELKWVLDAYTRSDRYPYSQPVDESNYMRNSVKVVIDAYDGTIDAYVVDSLDPIVRTYQSIFAGVFKPLSAMPADLRRHLRYPTALFASQAMLQSTYHMEAPETFYHREDQWQVPAGAARGQMLNPFMRHIILRLPGETRPEFIYMTPFTPRGKDNLSAWMVARMDGDNFGQLVVYRFPKQSLVYGPKQVSNRIDQETEISSQITLWDQRGSHVIRGELLVIPIEESLIYVQPLYLRADNGTIPELKRVIIAQGTRVVMGETLEDGLAKMFGGSPGATATDAAPVSAGLAGASADLARQAQDHYDRAISAQKAGNWAEYGREIDLLGAVLRKMRGAK